MPSAQLDLTAVHPDILRGISNRMSWEGQKKKRKKEKVLHKLEGMFKNFEEFGALIRKHGKRKKESTIFLGKNTK